MIPGSTERSLNARLNHFDTAASPTVRPSTATDTDKPELSEAYPANAMPDAIAKLINTRFIDNYY